MYLKLIFALAISFNFLLFVKLKDFHDVILNKRVEAFRLQLQSSCEPSTNCSLIAVVAADLCGRQSAYTPFCQTDCKFLINRLSKLATHLEAIDEILGHLPDDCSYKENEYHAPIPNNCDDTAEGCERTKNFEVQLDLRMSSDGKITIEDSNILSEAGKQLSNVTETENHSSEPLSSEPIGVAVHEENYEGINCILNDNTTINAGGVLRAPCSAVFGEKYGGDAIQFCSSTGVLLESSALCVEPAFAPFQFSITERAPMRSEPLQGVQDLSKYKGDLNKAADALKKIKEVLSNKKLKEFLPIAGKIASFLGPVGIAFQVVLFFIPSGPDKKHEEIMTSLKTLEENTDLIIKKIDRLEYVIRKELQDSKLNDIIVNLKTLEASFKLYSERPTEGIQQDVFKACKLVSGSYIVEYYLNLFNSRSLNEIIKMYDFHRNEFMEQLGDQAIINSIRGMSAEVKCFAMEKSVNAADIQLKADSLQPKLVAISEKIQQAYDEVIPKYAINEKLETDVKTLIRSGGSNKDLINKIRSFLDKSFDFYTFGIVVQNEAKQHKNRGIKTNCWVCVGNNIPGGLYVMNYHGKNVMVIYSNQDRCVPTTALSYVKKKVSEYHAKGSKLFGKKDAQDMINKIWSYYGSSTTDKSKKKENEPFNAIMIARSLGIEHSSSKAFSNAIGIYPAANDYTFFYVC